MAPASPQMDETHSEQQHFIATGVSMGERVLQSLLLGISQPLGHWEWGTLLLGEHRPSQRLSIRQEKCPCHPRRGRGAQHPRVPGHYRQVCPLVMVFHHRVCCQKEPAPVFPTETWGFGPIIKLMLLWL